MGTTNAGIAFCLVLPDYEGVLTREAALDETRRIAGAARIPVSVDAENGYGQTPEVVAEIIRRVAETGAVGASIENHASAYGTGELYDRVLAVERIEAAAATAASLPFPFTLTARTECCLVGHPNPFGSREIACGHHPHPPQSPGRCTVARLMALRSDVLHKALTEWSHPGRR